MENLHDKVLFHRHLTQVSKHFNELLKNPNIVSYLSWSISKTNEWSLTNVFFKEPGSKYSKQSWQVHQDNNYTEMKMVCMSL